MRKLLVCLVSAGNSERKINMKTLITTIAAVLLVGCGESQQSAPAPESNPEPPTAKAPDISIHEAAGEGNIEVVKQHLAAGTDVNAKTDDGVTPLHEAAGVGQKEITELLIAKGADVNANTPDGLTVFFAAILGANKEIVELLIAKGADVNVRGFGGMTPLNMADDEGEKEIAALLRKHGGKTGEELEGGESVAEATQPEPPTGKTPDISIHGAAGAAGRKGNIEAVKQHLAAGTDVDARDRQDKTPLQHAAYWGHKEIVELLIAKNADINAKDEDGRTALDWAVSGGKKEIADLLRKHGGKHGTIHSAVGGGDVEAVKEFLVAGADVNAKNNGGETPLDWAIHFKHPETADLLRKHGGKTKKELEAAGN
jgi:ankyrin repeat protein